MWNIPNLLTLFRIFLVPLLVVVLLTEVPDKEFWGLGIFLLAALTDALDGIIARRTETITTTGAMLDPIADKLLMVSAFIALVELKLAPAWMIVIIVGREFAVSGMRSVAAAKGLVIAASNWGKVKTASQVVAITLLILSHSIERWFRLGNPGRVALWGVLLLSLYSMARYFVSFSKQVDLGRAS